MTKPSARLTRRAAMALSGAGLAFAGLARASAHRARECVSRVAWVARRGALEVTHRMHAHDAELALADAMGVARPTIDQMIMRARLALYVEARFALADAESAPIPLELLGAESDGVNVYVYQEAFLDAPPAVLAVRDDILRDVFPDAVNLVNLEVGDTLRTLTFSEGGAGVQTATF